MNTPRNTTHTGTPLANEIGTVLPLRSESEDEKQTWQDTEEGIEQLKALELLPLVMDIVEGVNLDRIRPQDVENAAGPIRLRVTKARETLRKMHGLSETPQEREAKVNSLKKNIDVKSRSLQSFRDIVGQRILLPPRDADGPQQIPSQIKDTEMSEKSEDQEQQTTLDLADEGNDVEMMDELFDIPQGTEISGIDIPVHNGDFDME